jgi:hypothetical protein
VNLLLSRQRSGEYAKRNPQVGPWSFDCVASPALKGLYIVAQGKRTRVVRVFVPPWVEDVRDCRPSERSCISRRVTEAEISRGLVAPRRPALAAND